MSPRTATEASNIQEQSPAQFAVYTLVAATCAAVAAWSASALSLPVWAMFAGFIAWFTRPTASLRERLSAMLYLWLGMGLAAVSFKVTGALIPAMGRFALPAVVFLVGILVVGLRTTPVVNNMLCWFLGLVAFFAAELPLHVAFTHLGAATAIGGLGGWACHTLNRLVRA